MRSDVIPREFGVISSHTLIVSVKLEIKVCIVVVVVVVVGVSGGGVCV